jgi:hypothetical protein
MEELTHEVLAFLAQRMVKRIKIDWQFSIQNARTKLNSHYVKVHSGNQIFQET